MCVKKLTLHELERVQLTTTTVKLPFTINLRALLYPGNLKFYFWLLVKIFIGGPFMYPVMIKYHIYPVSKSYIERLYVILNLLC